jgi:hypothetical protein
VRESELKNLSNDACKTLGKKNEKTVSSVPDRVKIPDKEYHTDNYRKLFAKPCDISEESI